MKDSWNFRSIILRCKVIWGFFVGYDTLLKVLRHDLTFWSVLFCLERFSWFLSASERLLNILRHSIKFWGCSEAFFGILWILSAFESLEMFWEVVWRYSVFWHDLRRVRVNIGCNMILKHSGRFQCLLCPIGLHKGCYWLRGIFRYSEAFLWVLSCSKTFLKVLRHSLIFRDVLRLSDTISFILSSSEKLLKNLRSSLMFWGCLEVFRQYLSHSYGFPANLKGFRRFWGIPWRCVIVVRRSEVFLCVQSSSK